MKYEKEGLGERYLQERTEVIGEKPVPLSLCPPRSPHRPACHRVRTSTGEQIPELWHCL